MKINPETAARTSSLHPWRTLGVWLLVIAVMGTLSSRLLAGALNNDVAFTNQPESVKAQKIIDARFGGNNVKDTEFVLVSSETVRTWDPSYPAVVEKIRSELQALGPEVISSPVYTYVEAQSEARQLFMPDQHGVIVLLQMISTPDAAIASILRAEARAQPAGYTVQVLNPYEFARLTGATQSPSPDPPEAFILVRSPSQNVLVPGFADAVRTVEATAIRAGGADLTSPPFSAYDAQAQAASMVSADSHATFIPVEIPKLSTQIVDALRSVATRNSNATFTVQVAGQAALYADSMRLAEEDLAKGERFGLAVALIVLVVVFGSIVAAFLPLAMGIFSIAVALGLVALVGQLFHFNLMVTNMISMIGLAVGIDYSLFIVSRYREERKKGLDKLGAIGRSGATANRAVFFSGVTVVLALVGMFIIPVSVFRSLAGGAIFVTIAAIAASMTLLPALLALLGDRINWPRLSKRAKLDTAADPKGGFWDRVSRRVMARPVVFLVATVLVLGSLGAFYLQLHRGTSQNVSRLPDEFASKQAFLTLQRDFGAGGATQPAQIVLTGAITSQETQAAIDRLRKEISTEPVFSPMTTVATSEDGTTIMVSAFFRGDAASDPAFQAIRDLRSTMVPSAFAGVQGVEVLVGGGTASFTDFLSVTDRYQWIVLAFVLTLSFVLLTLVFRSIVVPIKAIIMNLLSVAAAYGAVTLVFQKGVGIGLFNHLGFQFAKVDAIESWIPLFLFSILFGLSMDYHVILLSRIREEYDKTGDNTEAVAYGLRTTAGMITGAAIIMVAVFISFAAGRIAQLQQMGFSLAVAVFLDATIVRTLLVPASMRLLGDLNWYLPGWLQWLPQLRVEGDEGHIEPPDEVGLVSGVAPEG